MARKVDGVSSILFASRIICRMVGRFGTSALQAATSAEYAAAVTTLVAVCQAFEAQDNYPGEIDRTPPSGPEDVTGS